MCFERFHPSLDEVELKPEESKTEHRRLSTCYSHRDTHRASKCSRESLRIPGKEAVELSSRMSATKILNPSNWRLKHEDYLPCRLAETEIIYNRVLDTRFRVVSPA